jgi:hypothetical protein
MCGSSAVRCFMPSPVPSARRSGTLRCRLENERLKATEQLLKCVQTVDAVCCFARSRCGGSWDRSNDLGLHILRLRTGRRVLLDFVPAYLYAHRLLFYKPECNLLLPSFLSVALLSDIFPSLSFFVPLSDIWSLRSYAAEHKADSLSTFALKMYRGHNMVSLVRKLFIPRSSS